jgi:hypothetical protein
LCGLGGGPASRCLLFWGLYLVPLFSFFVLERLYFLFVAFILLLLFSGFSFPKAKQTNKQKKGRKSVPPPRHQ